MNILNNPEAVLTLKHGDVVFVGDRECVFEAGETRVYFVTSDSDQEAHAAACAKAEAEREPDSPLTDTMIGCALYSDFIFHVRQKVENGQGAAYLHREEFVEMFKTGNYVIE